MNTLLYKRYFLKIVSMVFLVVCFSCNKLIDIGQPQNSITSNKVFSTDATAQAAINGLYAQMSINQFTIGLINIMASLSATDLHFAFPVNDYEEAISSSLSTTNNYVSQLWQYGYQLIYYANTIIEGANGSTAISASLKQQIIGQAKICRAFFYFYLTNFFGDIPLVTTSDYTQTTTLERTSQDKIYVQIIADLQDALKSLSPTYDSKGKAIASSWAAQALLARVYLYQKDWKDAQDVCNTIIISRQFQLEDDLNKVFLANSSEAIWQLAPAGTKIYTNEGGIFVPYNANSIPNYIIDTNLVNSFEAGDAREGSWIGANVINGTTYYYPFKYKSHLPSSTNQEYHMLIRLAEIYLIRAEAEAQQNNTTGALKDIDMLRSRAGLPLYSNDGITRTQTEVLSLILKERRHELFLEWGHRWFDVVRTGNADAIFGAIKPDWKSTNALYPVPANQRLLNPHLTQNPGYQ